MTEFKAFHEALLKNNIELQKRKFGRNNSVPNHEDIVARRDYVLHRLGATFSQLSLLRKTIEGTKITYNSIPERQWERIEAIIQSQNHVTYCFDNMIFNLASLSDYFGNYIGLYLFGPNFQTLKWSGFVNKTGTSYGQNDFGILVASENGKWFTKIHEFRGDIIHRKVIKAEVKGFEFTYINPQEVSYLDFRINDQLKKYFHIFRDDEDDDLYRCAERISNRTLLGMIEIMKASEKIVFDEKHHWTRSL